MDEIDATIDKLHAAGASDEEITAIIKEKYGKPFDVNAQNATMRQNMTAQDAAATREPASQWSPWAMGGRALSGIKGEAEGVVGGLAGLAALPVAAYTALRHPIATAKGIGTGAVLAGRMVQQAADNPSDMVDAAKRFGSNPENIGALAGGLDVALATPAITRAIGGTRLGRAVTTGISSAVDRVPGMKEARSAWNASAPAAATTQAPQPVMSPLELTRSMKPTGEALAQAKISAFGKPSFSAQEVLKIKMLIQQGLPQDRAIELVKSAVQ